MASNPKTLKLQKQLKKTHDAIFNRIGKTTDLDEFDALHQELQEVNFRLMTATRLLFKETTASIDNRVDKVLEAGADVDQAIKEVEKTRDVIKAIGKFLTNVDKVLDAIKILI